MNLATDCECSVVVGDDFGYSDDIYDYSISPHMDGTYILARRRNTSIRSRSACRAINSSLFRRLLLTVITVACMTTCSNAAEFNRVFPKGRDDCQNAISTTEKMSNAECSRMCNRIYSQETKIDEETFGSCTIVGYKYNDSKVTDITGLCYDSWVYGSIRHVHVKLCRDANPQVE
eukprot:Lankesteria_metandrocarpae@DN3718_c0_g1_i2.p1